MVSEDGPPKRPLAFVNIPAAAIRLPGSLCPTLTGLLFFREGLSKEVSFRDTALAKSCRRDLRQIRRDLVGLHQQGWIEFVSFEKGVRVVRILFPDPEEGGDGA